MTQTYFYNAENGHYYTYVERSGISWADARSLAALMTYSGSNGYLATITTAAEMDFIDKVVFSSGRPDNTFVGGSDEYQEGVWRWVTGPDGNEEGGFGRTFYKDGSFIGEPAADWISYSAGDTEANDYLYIYSYRQPSFNPWNGSLGTPSAGGNSGFLVEFGGANSSPTGAVAITGAATEGETLTAVTNTLADEDGMGELSFQWLRDGNEINGATASSYTLTQDDVGFQISLTVSYVDGLGTEESLSSAATAPVMAASIPEQEQYLEIFFPAIIGDDGVTGDGDTAPGDPNDGDDSQVPGTKDHWSLEQGRLEGVFVDALGVTYFLERVTSVQPSKLYFSLENFGADLSDIDNVYTFERTDEVLAPTSSISERSSAVLTEFGASAWLADWYDLRSVADFIDTNIISDVLDLREKDNPSIGDYQGDKFGNEGPFLLFDSASLYGSQRSYFVSDHQGTAPSNWLVHDTIADHQLDLGSWTFSRDVLSGIDLSGNVTPKHPLADCRSVLG